jgi:hypothetical protein
VKLLIFVLAILAAVTLASITTTQATITREPDGASYDCTEGACTCTGQRGGRNCLAMEKACRPPMFCDTTPGGQMYCQCQMAISTRPNDATGAPADEVEMGTAPDRPSACQTQARNVFFENIRACGQTQSPGGLDRQCMSDAKSRYYRALANCANAPGAGAPAEAAETPQKSRAAIRTGAGLCLDVHAPELGNNGGRVQVWSCHVSPQQTWNYDPAARAVRIASGLCLDVHAPEMTTNGGRVQVWACNGAPQQQWTPLANGSLRNAGGLCLDAHAPDQASNGGRVQVWQCNGSQQQRFTSSAF